MKSIRNKTPMRRTQLMNRRELFVGTAALSAGFLASSAVAQTDNHLEQIVDGALTGDLWPDSQAVSKLMRLCYALAELRIVYNGPMQHEAESALIQSDNGQLTIFQAITQSFDKPNRVRSALPEISADLRNAMMERLDRNGTSFFNWLEGLGVRNESILAMEFLSAQATFAVFGTVVLGNGQLTFCDTWTAVHPFCD